MADSNYTDTKIVIMSKDLMSLYEVQGPGHETEYEAFTFHDPQECLDMMVSVEGEEMAAGAEPTLDRADRIERQWGELELRLSFFTEGFNWQ